MHTVQKQKVYQDSKISCRAIVEKTLKMFLSGGQYENIAAKHWIRSVPLFYFHSNCDICHTEKCKTKNKTKQK